MDEIKNIGGNPYLQDFIVNDQDIHHVSLKDDLGNEYEVSAYGCCLNTPIDGIKAEFHYLETETEIETETEAETEIETIPMTAAAPPLFPTRSFPHLPQRTHPQARRKP